MSEPGLSFPAPRRWKPPAGTGARRVDVWLRAGMYEQAHSLIESMDDLVRLWGSGAELRSQREAVRGRLGDDREGEMMNLAALGDIYSYSGDLPSAVCTVAG